MAEARSWLGFPFEPTSFQPLDAHTVGQGCTHLYSFTSLPASRDSMPANSIAKVCSAKATCGSQTSEAYATRHSS
jgi:hypothetical protein